MASCGSANGRAKLTERDVRAILRSKRSTIYLGAKYGVDPKTISLIRERRTWKHIDMAAAHVGYHRKLSAQQIAAIRTATGLQRTIADKFGVSRSLVSKIRGGSRHATK